MENIVKGMLRDIVENPDFDKKLIHHYFADSYLQTVDHTCLNIDQFKQHIQKLKDLSETVNVEVLNYAVKDDTVFTKHLVTSTLKDGSTHTHKVIAEFIIRDGKIVLCDELTFLVDGSDTGKHLGSIM